MGYFVPQPGPVTPEQNTLRLNTVTLDQFLIAQICDRKEVEVSTLQAIPQQPAIPEDPYDTYLSYVHSQNEVRRAAPNNRALVSILAQLGAVTDSEQVLNTYLPPASLNGITRSELTTLGMSGIADPQELLGRYRAIIHPEFKTRSFSRRDRETALFSDPDAVFFDPETRMFIPVLRVTRLSPTARVLAAGFMSFFFQGTQYDSNEAIIIYKAGHGANGIDKVSLDNTYKIGNSTLHLKTAVMVEIDRIVAARYAGQAPDPVLKAACSTCRLFGNGCYDQGKNLTLVPRIGRVAQEVFAWVGITNIDELLAADLETKRTEAIVKAKEHGRDPKVTLSAPFWQYAQLAAKAFKERTLYRKEGIETFEMPKERHVIALDLETDTTAEGSFTYQIGWFHVDKQRQEDNEERYKMVIAEGEDPTDEQIMFYKALDLLDAMVEGKYDDFVIAHHSDHDYLTMMKLAEKYLKFTNGDDDLVGFVRQSLPQTMHEEFDILVAELTEDPFGSAQNHGDLVAAIRTVLSQSNDKAVQYIGSKIVRMYNFPFVRNKERIIDTLDLARKHFISPFGHSIKDYVELYDRKYELKQQKGRGTSTIPLSHSVAHANWIRVVRHQDAKALEIMKAYNFIDCEGVYLLLQLLAGEGDLEVFTSEQQDAVNGKQVSNKTDEILRRRFPFLAAK